MIPLNAELMIAAAVLVLLLVLITLRRRRSGAGATDDTADDAAEEVATEARFRRFMKKGKAETTASDEDVATTGTIPAVAMAAMTDQSSDETDAHETDAHETEAHETEAHETDIPAPVAEVEAYDADDAAHLADEPVADVPASMDAPLVAIAAVTEPHEAVQDEPSAPESAHDVAAEATHEDAPEIAPIAAHDDAPVSDDEHHNVHEGDVADLFFGRPYDHAADEPDWDSMRHPAPVAATAAFAAAPQQETAVMAAVPAAAPAITDDALITRPGWPLPGDLEAWESADMADLSNHPSDDDLSHWAEAAAARADNGAGFPPHDAGTAPGVHLSSPDHLGGPEIPAPGMPAAAPIGGAPVVPPAHDEGPMAPAQTPADANLDPSFWDIGNQAHEPAETWPPAPQPAETNQWTTPNNVAAPGGGMPEPTPAPATATPQTPGVDDWWTAAPAAPAAAEAPIHEPDPAPSGLQRPTVEEPSADAEWWGAPAAATPAASADETWWVAPSTPAAPAAPVEPTHPAASTPSVPEVAIPVPPAPALGDMAIPAVPVPPVTTPEPAPVAEAPAPVPPRYTMPEPVAPVAEPVVPMAEPQVVEQHVPPVAPPPVVAVTPEPVAQAPEIPSPEAVAAPAAAPAQVIESAVPVSVPPAARVLPRLDAGAKNPPANGRFAVGGTAVAPGDGAFTRVRFRAPLSRPIIGWGIGDEPDYAPGTLVLVVDAVLNCSADGLAVLQDDGDPNRPEGFTLSLSSHAPGPFAVSGTYHVVSD